MYSLRIQQTSYKTADDHLTKGFWDVDTFHVSANKTDDSTLRLRYGHSQKPSLQQDLVFDLKYNSDYYLVCHNDSMKVFEGLGRLMDYVVPLFEKAAAVARYNYKPSDARDVMETLEELSGSLGNAVADAVTEGQGDTIGLHNNHFGDLVICSLGSRSRKR
jgi:hypothetical protein